MQTINVLGIQLQLLPEKAIYVERLNSLLVSDVHLGKSETFQSLGVPVSNQVNQASLDRLQKLCDRFQPENLYILGDLFHSRLAMVDEVLAGWSSFLDAIDANVSLIVGNHDRSLLSKLNQFQIDCLTDSLVIDNLMLSHEPEPQPNCLNICGHIHPCVRIKTRLDNLRLPCFYLKPAQNLLMLPSFGEFTGGYEVSLEAGTTAYAIVDDAVIPFNKATTSKRI